VPAAKAWRLTISIRWTLASAGEKKQAAAKDRPAMMSWRMIVPSGSLSRQRAATL
jgi:hypothetical protein